jgi:hypothetical protein
LDISAVATLYAQPWRPGRSSAQPRGPAARFLCAAMPDIAPGGESQSQWGSCLTVGFWCRGVRASGSRALVMWSASRQTYLQVRSHFASALTRRTGRTSQVRHVGIQRPCGGERRPNGPCGRPTVRLASHLSNPQVQAGWVVTTMSAASSAGLPLQPGWCEGLRIWSVTTERPRRTQSQTGRRRAPAHSAGPRDCSRGVAGPRTSCRGRKGSSRTNLQGCTPRLGFRRQAGRNTCRPALRQRRSRRRASWRARAKACYEGVWRPGHHIGKERCSMSRGRRSWLLPGPG